MFQLSRCLPLLSLMAMSLEAWAEPPKFVVLRGDDLAQAKRLVAERDARLAPAWKQLQSEADAAAAVKPLSVMDKRRTPPSGDKHDYYTQSPYWWPKPADGLPGNYRDGQVNPESRSDDFDRQVSVSMVHAVSTLALAYYLGGNERYAQAAAKQLQVWFLDEATRMNPHLKFGQSIPGKADGRKYAIIETRNYLNVIDAAVLLESSPAWTPRDARQLRAWFAKYLDWLMNSELGQEESRGRNNHGTWYDAQVAGFALYVGQPEVARRVLVAARESRIAQQIEPDGSQPLELARTRSFNYSTMNLVGMTVLAELGRQIDVDLWGYPASEKPRIQAAVDFLAPYADAGKAWPHRQITPPSPELLALALRRAAIAYDDAAYERALARMPADVLNNSRVQLLYPR